MKLGLVGKMASGKTVLAQYFLDNYGGKKLSFADKLKEDVIQYGLTINGEIVKSRDRKLLQNYGQFRRGEIDLLETNGHILENIIGSFFLDGKYISDDINENHWINEALLKVEVLSKNEINIIFDDLRFVNECEYLKKYGFIIIKVNAKQSIREKRLLTRDGSFNPDNFNDISEMQLDNIVGHYEITNDDDNDSAEKQFDKIVSLIKK